ncbi:polar amino acid ABC transporter, inner membrane subunit [Rippkaea orientalis PCC 8801]|uniref:Polar amino acid ABC transporter, inner membrane subunit n=1 Tax=Rippkaea orientalis (strain PCC 8801 / RF-1) TaxID=41431 RepID=B7JZ18_RIPO1|nr:ABC transporter permease subunit [Rippkaea orientalis]ACK66095.1 polar amino acid ABC transporter, inner membrane subunit [Rippkaea orientalis PCC 8801]
MSKQEKIPFWRDSRFLNNLGQGIILVIVLISVGILATNLVTNFQRLGLSFDLSFIFDPKRPASFRIGDSLIPYRATDPYSQAILVGLLNSLRVMISGIILAFILGLTVGLGRLSDNWLVRQIATVYIETIRNTPLLLQLFFWYFAVFLKLPKIDNPAQFLNSFFLCNQGIYLPYPANNLQTWLALSLIAINVICGIIIWRKYNDNIVQLGTTGKIYQNLLIAILIIILLLIIWGLNWQFPQYNTESKRILGGLTLSPEFATLLLGLTVYTAAFIAEVIRAGIQSVSQGQWEAAKALGLNSSLVMRLVIFPQALRVIIPPLTSEFLNLVKNSSLAVAIGYNDIYAIANTISNQTGKAVEMLLVVMTTYLIFNLIIAVIMNQFNAMVQIKER